MSRNTDGGFLPNMQVILNQKDIFSSSSSGWIYSPVRGEAATLWFLLIRCLFHRLHQRPAASHCSLICTLIQAPLGEADFIKLVSWIKNEGVYFALRSAPLTADGRVHVRQECDKQQQKQHWFLQHGRQQVSGNQLQFVEPHWKIGPEWFNLIISISEKQTGYNVESWVMHQLLQYIMQINSNTLNRLQLMFIIQ